MSTPKIRTTAYRFPPSLPSGPTFGLQVTQLTGTYVLWVGVLPSGSEELAVLPQLDPLRDEEGGGSGGEVGGGGEEAKLGRDWAVGMPPRGSLPPVGTQLLRSSGDDLALPLAQRLARRFGKQVFLSVDVGDLTAGGMMGMGAEGARVVMDVERGLVRVLQALEER
ncbi:hypothetical protein CALVIDRAFT_566795 [Calocera viscosa TUFC12733]|uniref:Proteasome assembly chaperone 3 n=1 Tax=Calocera viscosa (strain TUFC12733) TaxID=1330018 RepID=A0A167IY48_CALVF|nr:hypothetical protein CALVIDRAFT_566795 [Calocera viscosa TUFC12733]